MTEAISLCRQVCAVTLLCRGRQRDDLSDVEAGCAQRRGFPRIVGEQPYSADSQAREDLTGMRVVAGIHRQTEADVGINGVGTKVLPRLLGTFRAEWPGVQIVLREARDCAELIHAVETGDVDVTFIDIGPYQTGPLEVRQLLDDPMVFLAPAGAPEAGRRAVSIADPSRASGTGTSRPASPPPLKNSCTRIGMCPAGLKTCATSTSVRV